MGGRVSSNIAMRVRAASVSGKGRLPEKRPSSSQGVGPALINSTRVMDRGKDKPQVASLLLEFPAQFGDGRGAVGFVEDGTGDDEPIHAGFACLADGGRIHPSV